MLKKKILISFLILLLLLAGVFLIKSFRKGAESSAICSVTEAVLKDIQDGDLIFQTSISTQSKAIQLATGSKYSHCGIIYRMNGKYLVFEAVQPVKLTPLDKWIARGKDKHYVVKRLKNSDKVLNPVVLERMKDLGKDFMRKNYDLAFGWSDEKIYCSELIWKIYQRAAGIEIGALQALRDFDLSHPEVKAKLKERYGDSIPMDEPVISPHAVFESSLLVTVVSK